MELMEKPTEDNQAGEEKFVLEVPTVDEWAKVEEKPVLEAELTKEPTADDLMVMAFDDDHLGTIEVAAEEISILVCLVCVIG